MFQIIQKRKIWLSLSSVLVVAAIVFLALWGLNFGIDFTGGALLEVRFENNRPGIGEVQEALHDLNLSSLIVQPVGESDMILRYQEFEEEKHKQVLNKLSELVGSDDTVLIDIGTSSNEAIETDIGTDIVSTSTDATSTDELLIANISGFEELRYDSVGPSIGKELKSKSVYAIIIVLICIVLYVAWTFRKVSKPVQSWKYGLTAIIALFHDVIIVLGVFSILGHFYEMEINTAFVAAILTVLGYSVNDTIVVFDRVRENLPKSDEDFEGTVNTSVNQTITRSINTSLTTLLVLISILIFGGATIRDFVLALSIGVLVGTYSSIFLASPVLVVWEKFKR